MEGDIAPILRDIAEQLRVRNEREAQAGGTDQQHFWEELLEEMRRLNRNLDRIADKYLSGGSL